MTRRAAAGLGRMLPLLLVTAAIVIVAGAALLGACGASRDASSSGEATSSPGGTTTPASSSPRSAATPSATPSTAAATTILHLYFLRNGKLGVAERQVPYTTMPATASLKALLAGPRGGEAAAGLGTAIPPGTRLLRLTIADGSATVDLSGLFTSTDGNWPLDARVAQIVYTLTRFPTVRSVRFLVEGQPVEDLGDVSLSGPQRRTAWRDLEPNIFVETPGVGAVLSSPFTLDGTAMVFEGSFQARLVDSSGRRIVLVVVQATRGAPDRGRFTKQVPFSTSARRGTLLVFDQSMEDGSRQDLVRIPVTFSAD